jgi:hypothetical protein
MNRKMTLMVLAAAVLVGSVGCRKQGTTPTETKKQSAAPQKGQSGTASSQPPTSVGGQTPPSGTARQPGAVGEANQPAAGRSPTPTTPASADLSAQSQAYVQGAEQTIIALQKQMSDLQMQIGPLKPEQQLKVQQLQEQFRQNLVKARAALDKAKTASGSSWADAKAAADKALTDASLSLKNLQSYMQSQTPASK